jgi:hypothetical protein
MKKPARKAKQPQAKQPEKKDAGKQQLAASGEGKQYGEGNYAATRQYNSGLKEHMQTHDIEREARDAAPRSPEESKAMSEAERIGRSRARGTPRGKVK